MIATKTSSTAPQTEFTFRPSERARKCIVAESPKCRQHSSTMLKNSPTNRYPVPLQLLMSQSTVLTIHALVAMITRAV